jgi:hypothetical protein
MTDDIDELDCQPEETFGHHFSRVFWHTAGKTLAGILGSALIIGPSILLAYFIVPKEVWTELSKPLSEVPIWVGLLVVWLITRSE